MGKNKQRKKKRKYQDLNYSDIAEHKRKGKKLVPPLNALPMRVHTSWRDDHAPEMLWAFLLAEVLPRNVYLACFREIVGWYRETFPPPEDPPVDIASQPKVAEQSPEPKAADFNTACELDHTSLSELSDEHFAAFLAIPLKHPLGYAALTPLLLIDSLPGIQRWRERLAIAPTDQDWLTLRNAVIATLDHQSEKSTDIRWLKYVTKIVLHKMRFVGERMAERGRLILRFPHEGDMHEVRPSIRAGEITMRRDPPSSWIEQFWTEMFQKTACIDPSGEDEYLQEVKTTIKRSTIMKTRMKVVSQFRPSIKSTRADARLDASFGFVLYALSLLEEIAGPPMPRMLVGRMALRSITEAVITFSYLLKKDDPTLWTAYRIHGMGQAKLAFLKLEEATGDKPGYVDQETLLAIANEDIWQEFLDVDLGHWANTNLRDLAIGSDTKDIYDRYYDWTSTVSHAQWCAVRDSNFVTCYNPLHRLHRIPRLSHRLLPSVVTDAVVLVNQTFDLLEAAYPAMEKLDRLREMETAEAEMGEAAPGMVEVPDPPEPTSVPQPTSAHESPTGETQGGT